MLTTDFPDKTAHARMMIKQLNKNDITIARQLFLLFRTVFGEAGNPLSEHYITTLLENPSFAVFAAIHNESVVGGLTAYELPMYQSEGAEMYIYDIAVAPEHQRKGYGRKLLAAIEAYCRQKGIRYLFVQANEEDAHAIAFYRSAGAKEERVAHFTFSLSICEQ